MLSSFGIKIICRRIYCRDLHRLREEIPSRKSLLRQTSLRPSSRWLPLTHWWPSLSDARPRESEWIVSLISSGLTSSAFLWFRFVADYHILREELLNLCNYLLPILALGIPDYSN